jgi:hypothetical protein
MASRLQQPPPHMHLTKRVGSGEEKRECPADVNLLVDDLLSQMVRPLLNSLWPSLFHHVSLLFYFVTCASIRSLFDTCVAANAIF